MAKKRCLSVDVFESESFLKLTKNSRILYVGLLLHADDDGIVENYLSVMRLLVASKKQIDELENAGFLIKFENVYVIKHWHRHNQIPPSKKEPSMYNEVLKNLIINGKKEYELKKENAKIPTNPSLISAE